MSNGISNVIGLPAITSPNVGKFVKAGPAGYMLDVPAGGVTIPPVVNGQWIKGVGGAAVWSPIVAADITSPVNGQFIKGSGGVAVWAPITPADVGLPKITTSAQSGGPPASPANNDIWIATGIGANNIYWMLQYDSSEATYKWKFVGGPANSLDYGAAAQSNTVANTWQQMNNPQITIARSGIYQLRAHCRFYWNGASSSDTVWFSCAVGGSNIGQAVQHTGATSSWGTGGYGAADAAITAGNGAGIALYSTNTAIQMVIGRIEVTPIKFI